MMKILQQINRFRCAFKHYNCTFFIVIYKQQQQQQQQRMDGWWRKRKAEDWWHFISLSNNPRGEFCIIFFSLVRDWSHHSGEWAMVNDQLIIRKTHQQQEVKWMLRISSYFFLLLFISSVVSFVTTWVAQIFNIHNIKPIKPTLIFHYLFNWISWNSLWCVFSLHSLLLLVGLLR